MSRSAAPPSGGEPSEDAHGPPVDIAAPTLASTAPEDGNASAENPPAVLPESTEDVAAAEEATLDHAAPPLPPHAPALSDADAPAPEMLADDGAEVVPPAPAPTAPTDVVTSEQAAPASVSTASAKGRARKGRGGQTASSSAPRSARTTLRQSVHGRQTIESANGAGLSEAMQPGWSQGTFVGMSTGLHLNGEQLTTSEENQRFRQRNKVRSSYRGPVYVAEDLHVPCQGCGGPVDPIQRVPVGSLFFHPTCIRCYLCGRTGVTEPFQQVGTHQVICSFCAAKGHAPCVRREEANFRGVVLGAIRGDPDKLLLACEDEARVAARTQSVNQATLAGAVAPSLTIGPVHTRRNTTSQSFALMQRQQYYTQNDRNILATAPTPSPPLPGVKTAMSARAVTSEDPSELAAIRARRRSGSTVAAGPLPKLTYH